MIIITIQCNAVRPIYWEIPCVSINVQRVHMRHFYHRANGLWLGTKIKKKEKLTWIFKTAPYRHQFERSARSLARAGSRLKRPV